jgi:hypothetical protein
MDPEKPHEVSNDIRWREDKKKLFQETDFTLSLIYSESVPNLRSRKQEYSQRAPTRDDDGKIHDPEPAPAECPVNQDRVGRSAALSQQSMA